MKRIFSAHSFSTSWQPKRTSLTRIRLATFTWFVASLVALVWTLTGCAGVERSGASGYADSHERAPAMNDRRIQRFEGAAERLGYEDPSSLTGAERRQVHLRSQLEHGEQYLEGKREREQYFKNKPYMKDDRERIAFLKLPDFETREKWLDAHHIIGTGTPPPPEMQNIVDQNDVAVGMTKQAVRDSWGPPDQVEVAGNPLYANEKWLYTEQVASTEGYRNEKRSIYFESGRVVGWERR